MEHAAEQRSRCTKGEEDIETARQLCINGRSDLLRTQYGVNAWRKVERVIGGI